jgi:simple sugar transport system permease protein
MKNSMPSPAFGAAQGQADAQAARSRRVRIEFARLRDLALVPALALLIVIGAFVSPNFLSRANLISVLGASAALALVVLAESLIVLTGKFDLSLESTVGIAPAIGAMLVMPAASAGFGWQWPAAAGLLAILVVGAVIGFINGFLVVRLRLNAFIVTLAMLIVLRGMLVGATKGGTLFDMPPSFFTLATTSVLGLPLSVWLAAVAFAVAAFMLRYHRLGRALYAIPRRRAPLGFASNASRGAYSCSAACWPRLAA